MEHTTEAPVSSDGFIRMQELVDEDPDPGRVEVTLSAVETSVEIIDGRPRIQQAYDGVIPGPLIRAKRGDVLKVNFSNEMSEGTTIHWHGMRVPNGMDGVPGMTQEVIQPGEQFVYEYPLLDASVFWYHPHFQTLSQVGNGLYGAVLVEDPDEEAGLGEEVVMAISDISLFEDGSIQHHAETEQTTLRGREGATLLLNGHPKQVMRVVSGSRLRWRVLNMARSRYIELSLEGHEFTRIGTDGGRMQAPIVEPTTRLTPGERADVIVEPRGAVGSHLYLVTLPVDRGPDAATSVGPEVLLRIEFVEGQAPGLAPLGDLNREIEPFDFEGATEVEIALTTSTIDGELVMGINDVSFSPDAAPVPVPVGERQVWLVKNETAHSHPFHMHGFFFQVLEEDGTLRSPLSYKDTIDIPPLSGLRLVPRFDVNHQGMWMFHCHILDHAESGMMGVLHLSDDPSEFAEGEDEGEDGSGHDVVAARADDEDAADEDAGAGAPVVAVPAQGIEAMLAELLASETYKLAPWVAETEAPRGEQSIVSPHGDVRVYANDVLLASLASGNGVEFEAGELVVSTEAPAHDPGSIAVKELYEGGELIGKAALFKLEDEFDAAYYCTGPADRCGTSDTPPVFGEGFAIGCGACHAGMVYTTGFPGLVP